MTVILITGSGVHHKTPNIASQLETDDENLRLSLRLTIKEKRIFFVMML